MSNQINQFAKISPLVNSDGYLLNVNLDGTISSEIASDVKLKPNEIGIVYNEDRLVTIYGDKIVNLGVSVYSDNDFYEMIKNNTDGKLNGKLFIVKRKTSNGIYNYDLMIVNNTKAYNVSKDTLYASLFEVYNVDSTKTFSNSYIGVVPYKVMRITIRIRENLQKSDGSVFNDYLSIYAGDDKIVQIKCVDIESISETNPNFETFECFTIFKNCLGNITVKTEDSDGTYIPTTIKNNDKIEICVEYVLN